MTAPSQLLDNPIWGTLVTRHAKEVLGKGRARRFSPEVSPLGGIPDETDQSLADLSELIADQGGVVLAQDRLFACPERAEMVHHFYVHQMHLTDSSYAQIDPSLERLGAADAAQMLALVVEAHPGPFALKTHELGEYWGIKIEGQLVAMAGERMKLPGLSEISGVATYEAHRGKGYAKQLCRHLMGRILERGENAFLHVETEKPDVENFYHRLGFGSQRTLVAQVFERA